MNGRELLTATLQGSGPTGAVSPFIAPNNIYEMFHYIPEIDTFFDPRTLTWPRSSLPITITSASRCCLPRAQRRQLRPLPVKTGMSP